MVECTYNTTGQMTYTRGGFSNQHEMCLMFLHYYPANRLAHCASRLTLKHVLLALGVNVWPITPGSKHLGLRIRDPWQYQNLTFSDYLRVNGGKNRAVNIRLQEASLHHSHMAECYDYGMRRVYAVRKKEMDVRKLTRFNYEFWNFRTGSSFRRRGYTTRSTSFPAAASTIRTGRSPTIRDSTSR